MSAIVFVILFWDIIKRFYKKCGVKGHRKNKLLKEQNNYSEIFLPTSKKEVEKLGWDKLDVILFSGDAYVDHPSFANALIGRYLQSLGLKVAIIPQPNWRDDLRDFKKLGQPNYFLQLQQAIWIR